MVFFICEDLGLLYKLNSINQKSVPKDPFALLLNCSRSLGGSGMLMDANNIEGGSLEPALMAEEPGGKGAPQVPRAESPGEEVTEMLGWF